MKNKSSLLLSLILLLFTVCCSAAELSGKVVGVSDGDTITVLDDLDHGRFKIRFHGIDCPEKNQDFGNAAKRYLSSLIFGKTVTVRFKEIDRYGRIVGKVYLNGVDVNLQMLQAGLAWHYKRYDSSQEYAEAEAKAKESGVGLWQQPNPTPPWEFRQSK